MNEKRVLHIIDLSDDEKGEQLSLCYEMFRCCLSLLNGIDADPVDLTDTAELDSDDMELYYKCRKIYEERKQA